MRAETAAALKRAIARYDERLCAEEQARIASEEFTRTWEAKVDQIVLPALEEVGQMLRSNNWSAAVNSVSRPEAASRDVVFQVFRGNMTALGASGRPALIFKAYPGAMRIVVLALTQQREKQLGDPVALEVIDARFVQQKAAEFFDRLVDEWRIDDDTAMVATMYQTPSTT